MDTMTTPSMWKPRSRVPGQRPRRCSGLVYWVPQLHSTGLLTIPLTSHIRSYSLDGRTLPSGPILNSFVTLAFLSSRICARDLMHYFSSAASCIRSSLQQLQLHSCSRLVCLMVTTPPRQMYFLLYLHIQSTTKVGSLLTISQIALYFPFGFGGGSPLSVSHLSPLGILQSP